MALRRGVGIVLLGAAAVLSTAANVWSDELLGGGGRGAVAVPAAPVPDLCAWLRGAPGWGGVVIEERVLDRNRALCRGRDGRRKVFVGVARERAGDEVWVELNSGAHGPVLTVGDLAVVVEVGGGQGAAAGEEELVGGLLPALPR